MAHYRRISGISSDRSALLGTQNFEQLFDRLEALAIVLAARRRGRFTQGLIVREERGDRRVSMHDDASPRLLRAVKSQLR